MKTGHILYPLEQFQVDYVAIEKLVQADGGKTNVMRILHAYFGQDPVRKEMGYRFSQIMRYLDLNLEAFDEAPLAVAGKKSAGINTDLLVAVWSYFTRADDKQILNPPPPKYFKDIALAVIVARKNPHVNQNP